MHVIDEKTRADAQLAYARYLLVVEDRAVLDTAPQRLYVDASVCCGLDRVQNAVDGGIAIAVHD